MGVITFIPFVIYLGYKLLNGKSVKNKKLSFIYMQYAIYVIPVIGTNIIEAQNCVEVDGEQVNWWDSDYDCGVPGPQNWEFWNLYVPFVVCTGFLFYRTMKYCFQGTTTVFCEVKFVSTQHFLSHIFLILKFF